MLSVSAFTGGINEPSARFRLRQLVSPLRRNGVEVKEYVSPVSSYPPEQKWLRPFWLASGLCRRVPQVVQGRDCDVTFLQREFFSTLATLERFTRKPRVLDVDDAIFLSRGGQFARTLAKQVDLIVCGNEFLAGRFCEWNPNVAIVPTAIDVQRYAPATKTICDRFVVGWIGTSSNFKYLYQIESALASALKANKRLYVRVVADRCPAFTLLPQSSWEYVPWSADTEVALIQSFDAGIMPLEDSLWEQGKCSFKMLQYLACGIPAVVSPVGMNRTVLALGGVGIAASCDEDWRNALVLLESDRDYASSMGLKGRKVVEQYFSVELIASRLAQLLVGLG